MSRIENRDELLAAAQDARSRERRALALDLFDAALEAIDPVVCTMRALDELRAAGERLDDVTVIAFGKAARGMAEAALARANVRQGLVVGYDEGTLGPLRMLRGGHPVPSADAAVHGHAVLSLARSLGPNDVALVLVSGGGSAMLELPRAGLSIDDVVSTTKLLLACGADIGEINAVRRALSQLKGGQLAHACGGARVLNVVLSDVIGSPLATIASGPTVAPDPRTPRALDVVARYALASKLSPHVLATLRDDATRSAPEPSAFARVHSVLAGDNATAQEAMVEAAKARGHAVLRRSEYLAGEARELGPRFWAEAQAARTVYVGGGETTVTLQGTGRGGRNHELALACLELPGEGLLASLGTDGVDGTSGAAGALVDGDVRARAQALGLDVHEALRTNDSAPLIGCAGGALRTGPTGTNVADVALFVP